MPIRVGEPLSLEDVVAVARGADVELPSSARDRIAAARDVVERAVASNATLYGVTTGFGSLANVRIDPDQADALQHGLAAKGFGFGGVQRERAYHDALQDLATPAMGHPPVIRVPAVNGDGAAAYSRNRDALLALVGS